MSEDRFDQDFDFTATQQARRQHTVADSKAGGPVPAIAQCDVGQFDHRIFHAARRYRALD